MSMKNVTSVPTQFKVKAAAGVRRTGKTKKTTTTNEVDNEPDLSSSVTLSGKVEPVYKEGVKSEQLADGTKQFTTDSKVQFNYDQETQDFNLKTPNGYQFEHGEKGLVGKGPDGKPVQGNISHENDRPYLNFNDKEGSKYKVDLQSLGMEATNKEGTVSQQISPQGDQMVAIRPKGGAIEGMAYFEAGQKPDIDPEMKFNKDRTAVTYDGPDGSKTYKLPVKVETKTEAEVSKAKAAEATAETSGPNKTENVNKVEATTTTGTKKTEAETAFEDTMSHFQALPEKDQKAAGQSAQHHAATLLDEYKGKEPKWVGEQVKAGKIDAKELDSKIEALGEKDPTRVNIMRMEGLHTYAQDTLKAEGSLDKKAADLTPREGNLVGMGFNSSKFVDLEMAEARKSYRTEAASRPEQLSGAAMDAYKALPEADQKAAGKSAQNHAATLLPEYRDKTPQWVGDQVKAGKIDGKELDAKIVEYGEKRPDQVAAARMGGLYEYSQDKLTSEGAYQKSFDELSPRQQNLMKMGHNAQAYVKAETGVGIDEPPPPKAEILSKSPSGVTRERIGDEAIRHKLGNGAYVEERADGSLQAFNSKGEKTNVKVTEMVNEAGHPDYMYTFEDGNNKMSVFKYSTDAIAESKDGKTAQIAYSDGRIFSAVRDGNKVHTSTIYPKGSGKTPDTSEGVQQPTPGKMKVDGKEIEMPLGDNWQQPEKPEGPSMGSNVIPGAFPTHSEAKKGNHGHSPQRADNWNNDWGMSGMGDMFGMGDMGPMGEMQSQQMAQMNKMMTFMMITQSLSSLFMLPMMMGGGGMGMMPLMMMF